MPKKKRSVAAESATDLSTQRSGTRKRTESGSQERRNSGALSQRSERRAKGIQGKKGGPSAPGTKNPERRCHATVKSTGLQCKRAAIKGGTVCTSHGGAAPQVQRSAKDRLLALVDPALAALDKVLRDPNADDAHRVRAALGILDRTGFRPGVEITLHEPTKWEQMADAEYDAWKAAGSRGEFVTIDASLPDDEDDHALPSSNRPAITGGGGDHTWEDVDQVQRDAQAEAWRDLDDADAQAYERGRIRPDENTVPGELVERD